MKSIVLFGVLILMASLVFGSMTSTVFAQDNPSILTQIAKRAQIQIQNQISDDTSEEIKKLFEEGNNGVEAIEESLSNDDLPLAKKHFLSTMKIFTEISHMLTSNQPSQTKTTISPTIPDPTNDLLRMQGYVNSLKAIAKNHNATLNFSELDSLFTDARNQINNKQFKEASNTIQEIKKTIIKFNAELRQQTSQQESNRAQAFAQKYLNQVNRLIEHTQKIGISDDIIQMLESSRTSLTSANSPSEIIQEVRNVLLLQQKYELSENKLLELRITQIEETMLGITDLDQENQETIQETLQTIRDHLSKNEFEQATDLLRSLSTTLE